MMVTIIMLLMMKAMIKMMLTMLVSQKKMKKKSEVEIQGMWGGDGIGDRDEKIGARVSG